MPNLVRENDPDASPIDVRHVNAYINCLRSYLSRQLFRIRQRYGKEGPKT